jgi:GntR family transcriptional repressor for pyruvate dehydrogenase complex
VPQSSRRAARDERARPPPAGLRGIEPLRVTRLPDQLAEQIRHLIVSEGVGEGARLPSERELAARFGASRPTVSQALRTLSLMGLVEVRRGSGAYVVRRPQSVVTASVSLMLDLDRESLGDLMQFRLWLETLGVSEAASRHPGLSPGEEAAIGDALGRMISAAGRPSEWIAADTVFHAALVRACGNRYLAAVYESVHTAVLSYELRGWVSSEAAPAWLRAGYQGEHLALHEPIAAAVLGHDPAAAAAAVLRHHQAMLRHLEAARQGPARQGPARPRRSGR